MLMEGHEERNHHSLRRNSVVQYITNFQKTTWVIYKAFGTMWTEIQTERFGRNTQHRAQSKRDILHAGIMG